MSAPQRSSVRSIGDGVFRLCLRTARTGRVVGNFSSGFYVVTGQQLFAIGGPTMPAGPIHLVLNAAPPAEPEQSVVRIGDDRLVLGSGGIVDLGRATRYQPSRPSPHRLREGLPMLRRLHRHDTVPSDIKPVWEAVCRAVEGADLQSAGRYLEGRGAGLTPTGDDLLAGLLLFARWADPTSSTPAKTARRAATSDLSRCFLAWAARGQSIQPVHDLVEAAISTKLGRFEQAAITVASIGSSSGQALLVGLGLAATAWPLS